MIENEHQARDFRGSSELEHRTTKHYDKFPFDFLTKEDEANIEALQPAPFHDFISQDVMLGADIAEIGCGPGRATMWLDRLGFRVTAVDISKGSLELARRRAPNATFVHASNLDLPLESERFDVVISDGVIHHTPDPYMSLSENVRILKRGGQLFLTVYNRRGYYYYLYTFLGVPIRAIEKNWLGRGIVYSTILPIYYAAHLVKSRGTRTWYGARNFFYDYIITPRASFHSREEIENWSYSFGLSLVRYTPGPGNVHSFVLRKL